MSKTVSALTAATALTGTEKLALVQGANSRRTTVQDIAAFTGALTPLAISLNVATTGSASPANPLGGGAFDKVSSALAWIAANVNRNISLTLTVANGTYTETVAWDVPPVASVLFINGTSKAGTIIQLNASISYFMWVKHPIVMEMRDFTLTNIDATKYKQCFAFAASNVLFERIAMTGNWDYGCTLDGSATLTAIDCDFSHATLVADNDAWPTAIYIYAGSVFRANACMFTNWGDSSLSENDQLGGLYVQGEVFFSIGASSFVNCAPAIALDRGGLRSSVNINLGASAGPEEIFANNGAEFRSTSTITGTSGTPTIKAKNGAQIFAASYSSCAFGSTLNITQANGSLIADSTYNAALDNQQAIVTKTGSYTLALVDGGKMVEMNVASANDLTVPPNSSVAFPIGTRIDVTQIGAGQTTIVAGSGVTIRQRESKLKLFGQWAGASLYKRALDEWILFGDVAS